MGVGAEDALCRRRHIRSDLQAGGPLNMLKHTSIWTVMLIAAALLRPQAAHAQAAPATPRPSPAAPAVPATGTAKTKAEIARWLDLQNATLNLRFRFIDTSAGVVTTRQLQHRESL